MHKIFKLFKNVNIMRHIFDKKKVIQGHIRPLLCQNHSRTFVHGPILMKICMNANIMKTQFSH